MEPKKYQATITLKGIALVAAIAAGLCPEMNGEINTAPFERFWAQFEPDMYEWMKRYPEKQAKKSVEENRS